ncbi:hypothetical protein HG535_0G01510 [Zygotorulaspora mrakii]|uniref:Uncharacterized protein n=1 Tax=Zygotorulaspora mrakii TaxID=42260 RepID=A0A7H9B6S8_ZYGMR|nr:uncharacterized protein HG535_0G01510 [Zygotorulaspora mrakii]QLG74267.1 hypothetical protein HG535_0G01510 [Zygotorulaspora mrakii]
MVGIMIGARYLQNDFFLATRGFARHYTSNANATTVSVKEYLKEPAKLIAIPVTNKRIYIYHKHTSDILNDSSRIIRFERWINKKSARIWDKLNQSPKSYNKKIVSYVNRLLDNTPWTENSLKSIPGENYILKRVTTSSDKESHLTLAQFARSQTPLTSKPLSVYYPSKSMTRDSVLLELRKLCIAGMKYHKKQLWLCLLGLPLTLPVVLVPLIPNVPGFYLTYRAYSNFKALLGARHLQTILDDQTPPLTFRDVKGYSEIVSESNTITDSEDQASNSKERLILNERLMSRIVDVLEIQELKSDLEKVIRQERKRLQLEPETQPHPSHQDNVDTKRK